MPTETPRTVAEIAIEKPEAAREFEKLGIDYCCGGQRSLEEACSAAGVPLTEVTERIEKLAARQSDAPDFSTMSLAELIAHITSKHHVFVREECPRIQELSAKVAAKHVAAHAELEQIHEVFGELSAELSVHLMKEEQILFPYVLRLEEASLAEEAPPPSVFGTVANPIHMMEREHDGAGEALRALRRLSSNYTVPEGTCTSFRTLYVALQNFETDLHQHIHLENNVLFPGCLALETRRFI